MNRAQCSIRLWLLSAPFVLALAAGGPARAEEFAITFDSVPVDVCGEAWDEQGCTLTFGETTATPCQPAGQCDFTVGAGEVQADGILAVQIGGLQGIERIEIDIEETVEAGCVHADFYLGITYIGHAESSYVGGGGETLVYDAMIAQPTSFGVIGHGMIIRAIRFNGAELVPVSESSWSAVKTLYR